VYRRLRSGILLVAGPADSVVRALTGRRNLPPLWLRRHTGPVSHYETAAADMFRLIDQLDLVNKGDRVLDIGCGPGSMVRGLLDRAGREGSYVGFDVHRPSIDWCQRLHREDARCRFELARLASPYASPGGGPVENYSFPVDDGESDFVLAKSVFTHLEPGEAKRYLAETRRALRPGRAAIVTAFLFESGSRTGVFRCADETDRMRRRSRLQPRAAIAYEKDYFYELAEQAGLRVQWLCAGFFPGETDRLTGQDILLLGH
jgi:SAM-dependent methyltransferase